MRHDEFYIGKRFCMGGRTRICTDVGTRVITFIDEPTEDPSWANGPPYALAEHVCDEDDMRACEPVDGDAETG